MDVSDIRCLQIIYVIMDETESDRESLFHYEFRFLILESLEKCGFSVRVYDEGVFLYTVDHKILIYFPEFDKSCKESKAFLNYALTHCILPIRIGYVIPNKSGACIIRIELPDLYT